MDIVHVSPEFAPLVKAGGLADVVYSLSLELVLDGHSCCVLLPYYGSIPEEKIEHFKKTEHIITTLEGNALISWEVYQGAYEGISLFLLKPNHPRNYFSRGAIYGEIDDNDRFILFSLASAFLIEELFPHHIVHLHDWQTALIAPLLFETHPIVYTIHNLSYQGICSIENLEKVNLERFISSLTMPHAKNPSLTKGGIEFSFAITTVSPTYAKEIQTSMYGCGLEALITHHAPKLVGILNGLDIDYWNPQTDSSLSANYSLQDGDFLQKKEENKKALFAHFRKPYVDAPLICGITRLVPQKSPDLIEAGIKYALKRGASVALSGTVCNVTKEQFTAVENELTHHPQALLHFGFNEPLAHLIYAAADYILIPSAFEPCGLTQMISLLYGTIPIVTATGGLKDTITDLSSPEGNGIVLADYTKEALYEGIQRALDIPLDVRKDLFLQLNREKYSWKASLSKYIAVYKSLLSEELL